MKKTLVALTVVTYFAADQYYKNVQRKKNEAKFAARKAENNAQFAGSYVQRKLANGGYSTPEEALVEYEFIQIVKQ